MAISFVQSASNSGTATILTITLGTGTTAGNCLVVASGASGTVSNPAILGIKLGGSAGNFAQLATVGTSATSAAITEIWADPNCVGSQTSIVITFVTQPSTSSVWVYEFSGIASSSILDKSSTAFTTSTQAAYSSGTTATTTQANELWFGADTGYNTTITPPASPWNNRPILNSGTRYFVAGYQIVSSTGIATYSGSYSPNSYETAAVVTLKASMAVPPTLLMTSFP